MTTLRLRPDLHYAPIEGGVYLSSARATFVMSGPPVLFRVVDTCVPLLEDGASVDDLVEAVGTPASRPLVQHLVATLDSRDLILRPAQLEGPQPSAGERQRFAEALAYLETYQAQPYADFRRVRAATVLVAGPNEALGPAGRGLLRAGVGQVVLATPEPARLGALAARHPEIRVVAWSEGQPLPGALAGSPLAAVVFCTADEHPPLAIGQAPGCAVVPVHLGKSVAIVGPALPPGSAGIGVSALWDRIIGWGRIDCAEARVRPSGDLLAGALAGQLAFDHLVGLNPGQVHVVHGQDLAADSLVLEASAGAASPSAPGNEWISPLTAPWTGLFRLDVPGELPQLPLALTVAESRAPGGAGRVMGFGPDQEASTVEAALEALRRHCELAGVGPGTAAAGVTGEEWHLDGALRLLARESERHPHGYQEIGWHGLDDAEARRWWRVLEEYELVPLQAAVQRAPGFPWVLATVCDRRDAGVLGQGWGPDNGTAAAVALASAVATAQVRRTLSRGPATVPRPGFHHRLHGSWREALATAVRAWLDGTGRRLVSRRLAADEVAGVIGAWCGRVALDA